MSQILFATHNAGKLTEARQILEPLGYEVLGAEDVNLPDVEETGATFEDNAALKAKAAARHAGVLAIADDSGLVVDALDGAPGVHSSRYAGAGATDADRIEKLLRELGDAADRTARFVCALAVATPAGDTEVERGVCEGRVTKVPRGEGGFGYDPLFVPDGYQQTFAELAPEVKNRISHRGLAFEHLPQLLTTIESR